MSVIVAQLYDWTLYNKAMLMLIRLLKCVSREASCTQTEILGGPSVSYFPVTGMEIYNRMITAHKHHVNEQWRIQDSQRGTPTQ